MRGLKISLFMLAAFLLVLSVRAEEPERIISNSADWKDVYSVMLFGSLTNRNAAFLVSERHSALMADSIPAGSHVWVVSSKKVPYTVNYAGYLEGRGFTTESFTYDNANLELARQADTKSFIIVDDSYGYNAISVAPYAVASKSFVLFADETNIDEIDSFLTEQGATKVLIYGHVDRIVKDTLSKYNLEIINKDGDRFANNIEIVKRFQEINHAKQAILTNGEFIEQEIMSGTEPVIFIGRNNVPDIVRNYIQNSEITVGVLIGNELVNTATFIRRQIGISVFVKFARSARSTSASISQVEALDMYYLPTYSLNLEVDSLNYNRATKQLEVVMHNTEDVAAYFKGTYSIISGASTQTVGDVSAVFIEPNSYKTVTYVIDEISEAATINIYVIYGESKNSLEHVIDEQYCAGCEKNFFTVDIIDKCKANMSSLSYNLARKLFYADVSNVGAVSCYVDVELVDVVIAAERVTLQLENSAFMDPGESKKLKIKGALEEEDLEDNEIVTARLYYGQRENSLVSIFEGRFPLLITSSVFSAATIASYTVLAVIVLIIGLFVWKIFSAKILKKP